MCVAACVRMFERVCGDDDGGRKGGGLMCEHVLKCGDVCG